MSDIFFTPWIGRNYDAGLVSGKRVLILGESHYQRDAKAISGNLTCRIKTVGAVDAPMDCVQQPKTWRYPLPEGGSCLAYGIRHPSSGLSGIEWHPHILEVIKRA